MLCCLCGFVVAILPSKCLALLFHINLESPVVQQICQKKIKYRIITSGNSIKIEMKINQAYRYSQILCFKDGSSKQTTPKNKKSFKT